MIEHSVNLQIFLLTAMLLTAMAGIGLGATVGTIGQISILGAAALLDFGLGDPWGWPHPVQGMGWCIQRYQGWIFSQTLPSHWKIPLQQLAGVGLALGLIGLSGGVGWFLVAIAGKIHPILAWSLSTVLLASCFAGHSLRQAAMDVLHPLATSDLDQARQRLGLYVGRDTENLSEPEILRAVLETVTENATDGVLAPLFYGLVGAALPGVGPVPLALAYKAASTLDSMVGYRQEPYTHLGWCSAKLEDGLTWLPCRLLLLTLALWSRRPSYVLRLCQRDAPADPSPNAGWSECAYAAVLGVQMGGPNWYGGVLKQKPYLGEAISTINPTHINQALHLTRTCFLLWLSLGCGGLGLPLLIAWGS